MAKVIMDGNEFEVPEGVYTGEDLKNRFAKGQKVVPVVRSGNNDNVVEPNEQVNIKNGDQVIMTSPMEAA